MARTPRRSAFEVTETLTLAALACALGALAQAVAWGGFYAGFTVWLCCAAAIATLPEAPGPPV